MTDLVQPILIVKNKGTHEEVVTRVAMASVLAIIRHENDPRIKQWLAGRFVKSVRRGSQAQIDKICDLYWDDVSSSADYTYCIFPTTYDQLPIEVSKLQVSDYNRPKSGKWNNYEYLSLDEDDSQYVPDIYINPDIEMTTGKTAAQVAHGLCAWYLKQDDTTRNKWGNMGYPISITDNYRAIFKITLDINPYYVFIYDAGFTEIEPNSLTVIVPS